MIFNLTVSCKSEDESDLEKVATTVNRLLRIAIKVFGNNLKEVSFCDERPYLQVSLGSLKISKSSVFFKSCKRSNFSF